MRVKFEPSGTHVDSHGFLKVRFGIFPQPDSATYPVHHVNIPVIPPEGYPGLKDERGFPVDPVDYKNWLSCLPHIWQLNPMLNHFMIIPENVNKGQLISFIQTQFNPGSLVTLDNIMAQANATHRLNGFFRRKPDFSNKKVVTTDIEDLKNSVNQLLAGIDLNIPTVGGQPTDITPESIDVGPGAIDRINNLGDGWTAISADNPANASGTITSHECWFFAAHTHGDYKIGSFYDDGSPDYTCRAIQAIGAVVAGSKQTFNGLSMAIVTGDLLGYYFSTDGDIEWDMAGEAGMWAVNVDSCTPTTTDTYGWYDGDEASIYATGSEPGFHTGGAAVASALVTGRII